ncbi:MAG: VOC family protein [Actinomycetota bacterium]|nr:VOC family protein [Actinomycetota bacterium]
MTIAHFGINTDDVDATRRFYEAVFGWTFTEWGPPNFFQITTPTGGRGALQQRRDIGGHRVVGYECTFGVDDVDAVARSVVANGGTILMDKTTITGVGDLIWFDDGAGNVVGAMRYDAAAE